MHCSMVAGIPVACTCVHVYAYLRLALWLARGKKIKMSDDRWHSHYFNAAELLFGKTGNDTLTPEEDEACIAEADARMAAEMILPR